MFELLKVSTQNFMTLDKYFLLFDKLSRYVWACVVFINSRIISDVFFILHSLISQFFTDHQPDRVQSEWMVTLRSSTMNFQFSFLSVNFHRTALWHTADSFFFFYYLIICSRVARHCKSIHDRGRRKKKKKMTRVMLMKNWRVIVVKQKTVLLFDSNVLKWLIIPFNLLAINTMSKQVNAKLKRPSSILTGWLDATIFLRTIQFFCYASSSNQLQTCDGLSFRMKATGHAARERVTSN